MKGMGWLTLNSETDFISTTCQAMDNLKPLRGMNLLGLDDDQFWERWLIATRSAAGSNIEPKSGLMKLIGVSYPMATAILCTLDEQVWPVMDRYAVKTVFGTNGFDWQRAVVYQAFSRWLATKGPLYWTSVNSVHGLDQAAMRASMPDGCLPVDWTPAVLPSA